MGFVRSKWPHLHRVYLLRVRYWFSETVWCVSEWLKHHSLVFYSEDLAVLSEGGWEKWNCHFGEFQGAMENIWALNQKRIWLRFLHLYLGMSHFMYYFLIHMLIQYILLVSIRYRCYCYENYSYLQKIGRFSLFYCIGIFICYS